MDPEVRQLLQILFIVGLVIFAIARSFLRIFVKPFVHGSAPGTPEKRKSSMKDFLDELRKDMGHENPPPPAPDGLLDQNLNRGDEEDSHASPAATSHKPHVEATLERPIPPPRPPVRTPSPPLQRERQRPAVRPPRPAERAAASQRMESALTRRAARARPAALEMNREEIETDALALAASEAPSLEEDALAGLILGTDLETAFILKEVLGPPRAYGRIRPRR